MGACASFVLRLANLFTETVRCACRRCLVDCRGWFRWSVSGYRMHGSSCVVGVATRRRQALLCWSTSLHHCTKGIAHCFTIAIMSAGLYTDSSRNGFPVSLLLCRVYEARFRIDSVLAWGTTCENYARQRTSSLGPKKTNATYQGGTSRKGCSCMLACWCLVHSAP